MTAALLKHGDYNVIVVHWPAGAIPPYTRATANTRLVGLEIALLVNTLIVSPSQNSPSLESFKEVNQLNQVLRIPLEYLKTLFG